MENERMLQRQIRRLQLCLALLALAVLVLLGAAFTSGDNQGKVLRVRGLIIEDAQGRERILIGAPIPTARNRVRTDLARVRQLWSKRFPPQYMELYGGYQHDMNGILILDPSGFDRIALGDPSPDPNNGKRIAPVTGLVINDQEGLERTGYGLLKLDNGYQVALGMDNSKGQDSVTMFLQDGGPIGFQVEDGSRSRSFILEPEGKK